MTDSAITIRKPTTEVYGRNWPYKVWIDGRLAGTLGRHESEGKFLVEPGEHSVSVSTSRIIRSELLQLAIDPESAAHFSMRRLAGVRVPLKMLSMFILPPVFFGPGSRWAERLLFPGSTGFWAPLSLSLVVGLALTAAFLAFTLLVTSRYWVWWSLESDEVKARSAEHASAAG